MASHVLSIPADGGSVRFIWADELASFQQLGLCSVQRASHVEPAVDDAGEFDGWRVDLSPVGGGKFGPFRLRATALAFERQCLEENHL